MGVPTADRLKLWGLSWSTDLGMHPWAHKEASWEAHSVSVMLWATQSRPRANSCFMSMIHSVSSASSSVAPAPHPTHSERHASKRTAWLSCRARSAEMTGLRRVVQVDQRVCIVGSASTPVSQKARVPKPDTGRSSSWPHAERT